MPSLCRTLFLLLVVPFPSLSLLFHHCENATHLPAFWNLFVFSHLFFPLAILNEIWRLIREHNDIIFHYFLVSPKFECIIPLAASSDSTCADIFAVVHDVRYWLYTTLSCVDNNLWLLLKDSNMMMVWIWCRDDGFFWYSNRWMPYWKRGFG